MVELVLKVKTKHGKHTLKEDREKRTEKYRPWERWTDNKDKSPGCRLDTLSPSVTSNSGLWLPTPEFQYKPKLFSDPRSTNSDKENMPPLEPNIMPVLNIEESDFLERMVKLLEKDNKWEAQVAQQIPVPRSSSPYPDNQPGTLEQLEPKTEDDMAMRDISERPTNDKRPPKPPHASPRSCSKISFLLPGFPDYMMMIAAPLQEFQSHNQQKIRGILPEKKKIPRGWPACLKRSPPKAALYDNDIYSNTCG